MQNFLQKYPSTTARNVSSILSCILFALVATYIWGITTYTNKLRQIEKQDQKWLVLARVLNVTKVSQHNSDFPLFLVQVVMSPDSQMCTLETKQTRTVGDIYTVYRTRTSAIVLCSETKKNVSQPTRERWAYLLVLGAVGSFLSCIFGMGFIIMGEEQTRNQ
jgi:hypothetical protein